MTVVRQDVEIHEHWNESDAAGRGGADDFVLDVETRIARLANISPLRLTPRGLSLLVRTIETDIVPRLVLACRTSNGITTDAEAPGRPLTVQDFGDFAEFVLRNEVAVIAAALRERRQAGASLERLYLELLAPVAQRLGEMWSEDLCTFAEVTIGLGRLQQVVLEFAAEFHQDPQPPRAGRRILLSPVPGEQHVFGLLMLGEFFRRAGWDVWSQPAATQADLVGLVRREWFSVIGFTASSETSLGTLGATIRAVRRASANRALGVMVGGDVFTRHPEFAVRVGADATGGDAVQATQQAERLVGVLVARE